MIRFFWLIGTIFLLGCQSVPTSNTTMMGTHQRGQVGKLSYQKMTNNKKGEVKNLIALEQDGAPSGPLPTFFKKVFPRSEPVSRYGNPGTYKVNGRTYKVMTSAKGYKARGQASWYGTKFHSKRTSSGENYNLYSLTAAHTTLPLPTYVRVKNLKNGKEVIVKVNDRGPFHSDRIIDLSYGAAVKLGLLPQGTAPVEIEALTTNNYGKNNRAQYYLQAGAFTNAKLAQIMRDKLKKLTPAPVFVEKYKHYYVVNVGPFATKRMSDNLKNTLTKKGVKGLFSLMK